MLSSQDPTGAPLPAVSIGMPAYNSSHWIAAAIESLLGQTFRDFELIISDNASSDSTFDICRHYARADARIRLLRNPRNIGANRNYLAVLAAARGTYFKWASSNDVCDPAFIESSVRLLETDPSAVLACPRASLFQVDVSDAQPYPADFALTADSPADRLAMLLDRIRLNNAFNGVMRTEALRRAAPMGSFQRADIALMAELAMMGRFLQVERHLFFRRMSEDAATRLKTARQVDEHLVPDARAPLRMQNWLYYLALLRAAGRQKQLASLWLVLKRMRWARAALVHDVSDAFRSHW